MGAALTFAAPASYATSLPSFPGLQSLPSVPGLPPTPPIGIVPFEVSPPVISGTAEQGQTVSCSSGSWLGSPTGYAYSWQRDGSNIASETSTNYTLAAADVNHAITCTVVASNGSGDSTPAVSPPIVPLAPPAGLVPVATGAPSISGSAVQGQTVTCSPGSWLGSPSSYSYSWERDAIAIAGQTVAEYTLTGSDVGQAVTCSVVAQNASGDSLPAVSMPIIPALASVGGGGGGGSGSGGGAPGGNPGGGSSRGGGGSVKPKLHAPTIKAFSVTPGTLVVLVKGKRRSTKGATFHLTLDQKAGVLIELYKQETGRVKGKGCVAVTHRNAKAKRCTRWVVVKLLTIKSANAGSTKLKYAGHVGKHLIGSGTFRAYAAAVAAGGWSKLRWTSLSVKTKNMKSGSGRQKPNHHHT